MTPATRNKIAEEFVSAFGRLGSRAFIGNLDTEVRLHQWGEHRLPMTVNHGERGETFVCSPRVGYIDYPIEELSRFPNPYMVPALRALIRSVSFVLSRCNIDRIVHINNWMMSTNLPVALDSTLVKIQTDRLAADYPSHLLAIRSLTLRYSAELMAPLREAGWVLLPSRQVFLLDDVTRESAPRRDAKRDHKLWRRGDYAYEELTDVTAQDAIRIEHLYRMLYIEKYSTLNPSYTAQFVIMTHRIGLIRYLVLRDQEGVIQSFGGMHRLGQYATMPMIGYNTAMDRKHGLYRLAFHAGSLFASKHELFFNMSSGAAAFKRSRGATPEIEFTAFYLRHLPRTRRYPFAVLESVAKRIGIPLLKTYEL